MSLFNPGMFNGPELFNTGESVTPPPDGGGAHRKRVRARLELEWTIEQDDAELLEILGVLLRAD